MISPIIIEWTYKDGTKEIEKLPAEIWRTNEVEFKKVFVKEKEVVNIVIDPNEDTADINQNDNTFPRNSRLVNSNSLNKRIRLDFNEGLQQIILLQAFLLQ